MKSLYKWGAACILCGAMASFTAPVFAQEAAPAVAPAEESKTAGFLKSVEIGGFVDTFYKYNYNKNFSSSFRGTTPGFTPIGRGTDVTAFDREHNSFTLDNVEISIFKASTEKDPIGFGFTTNYGEIAQRLTFVNSQGRGDGLTGSQDFTISQGFVTYKAPVGKGIDFKVGKFATWIGAELWESVDNPNYSRSLLYQNAIPFTNTGISAAYPVTDKLTVTGFLVNGWDTFVDNNNGKTGGYQFAYKFTENTSLILNGSHGPEQPKNTAPAFVAAEGKDPGDNLRHFWDVIFAFKPLEKTTVNLNVDFGTEAHASGLAGGNNFGTGSTLASTLSLAPGFSSISNGKWWGGSAIVSRDITDSIGVALRGEYFDDNDGARIGVRSLRIWETTFTTNIKIRQNLYVRPEVRYDKANKDIFGTSTSGNLSTLIAFSYLF
ncbi:MAG: porin [Planctomycetota bacterium]|nr:outer membrane beta-barrel protein [Planctomycetota bacterium]MDE1890607.1 porin [Planctomycetota bacterium]MDE2216834.1 porin [Planctomycetota bacterium]